MYALIDGAVILTRSDLHDALSRQLLLPDWYGGNLDALFDCLTELDRETELQLIHTEDLRAHLGGYADSLQRVLRDACEENPLLHYYCGDYPKQDPEEA